MCLFSNRLLVKKFHFEYFQFHFEYFNSLMSNTADNTVAGRAVDITSNPVHEFNGDEKGTVRCSPNTCDVPYALVPCQSQRPRLTPLSSPLPRRPNF